MLSGGLFCVSRARARTYKYNTILFIFFLYFNFFIFLRIYTMYTRVRVFTFVRTTIVRGVLFFTPDERNDRYFETFISDSLSRPSPTTVTLCSVAGRTASSSAFRTLSKSAVLATRRALGKLHNAKRVG